MALAIFDLDNTLIGGDSDYLWGEYLVQNNLIDAAEYKKMNDKFYADYEQGVLDIYEYQRFSLQPLVENTAETLAKWYADFIEQSIKPILLPKAFELIEKHKNQGDKLLIITATNTFITRPIGKLLGIEDLIGVEPEIIDGKFTGKIVGVPSFQAGKVTRLNEWLIENDYSLAGSYFYSDSINDLFLLEKVDNPVVVDGDDKLLAIAKDRNWQSISLRG